MQEGDRRVNPITGEEVDVLLKEHEAREKGYLDFQFMLRYLEDENEFVKYFIIDGKKVLVDMARPMLQYKKKPNLDHERLLNNEPKAPDIPNVPIPVSCSVDDPLCLSCGS